MVIIKGDHQGGPSTGLAICKQVSGPGMAVEPRGALRAQGGSSAFEWCSRYSALHTGSVQVIPVDLLTTPALQCHVLAEGTLICSF